jgi:hypothetical protein
MPRRGWAAYAKAWTRPTLRVDLAPWEVDDLLDPHRDDLFRLEHQLQVDLDGILTYIGAPYVHIRNPRQSMPGAFDTLAIVGDTLFNIELKRPGGKLSKFQQWWDDAYDPVTQLYIGAVEPGPTYLALRRRIIAALQWKGGSA